MSKIENMHFCETIDVSRKQIVRSISQRETEASSHTAFLISFIPMRNFSKGSSTIFS